jgi:hypothetical protein
MKRKFAVSKTILAFAFAVLLDTSASANSRNPESPVGTMAVQVSASSLNPRLIVRVAKPEGRRAHLRLENEYGQPVFLDQARKADRTWNRALRLHELPRGTYHLVVSDHRYRPVYRQRVELTTTVVPEPQTRIVIP